MALIVVALIVFMSIWLGAEQCPKADPTTTTYVPRPDWYFFFLFELLRVIKPNELVPIATIGVPTIAMVLLFLLPFYDRNPERNPLKRPIATVAGLLTIASMAFLTFLGANAGSPTDIDIDVAPQYNAGKLIAAQSGCLACHQFGDNGNNGPGPKLTEIGARLNPAAIARSLEIGPGIMPSYAAMAEDEPEKFRDLVAFLGSLNGEETTEPTSSGSPDNPDAALPDESGGNPAAVEPAGGSSP
jgi:mono/diheme cytochrome c family protein